MDRLLVMLMLLMPLPALAGQTIIEVPFEVVATWIDTQAGQYTITQPQMLIGQPLPAHLAAYAPPSATVLDYDQGYGVDDGVVEILVDDQAGTATLREIRDRMRGVRTTNKPLQVRRGGHDWLQRIADPYSPGERETWEQQLAQARAYIADPEIDLAEIPMLATMAQVRGAQIATLAGYIIENNARFQVASGLILGRQQWCLDKLDAATTWDEYMAVDCWAGFSLPGVP